MRRLSDNVVVLGNGYFNFYLVGKEEAVLLECGTRAGAAVFKQEWEGLEDKPAVKYIVILHSHFDHACGIPILKELFPDAEVLGSAAAQKFLSKEKIVKDLYRNDAILSECYFKNGLLQEKPDTSELDFIGVDRAVAEGDILELEPGLQLKFIDAPGHSVCSIAAYLASDQAMFVSDATGYRSSKDDMTPVFFQGYDLYTSTIEKLMSYPTQIVGVAHGDIPLGNDVEGFYQNTLLAAEEGFDFIKTRLNEGMDEKELAKILFDRYIKGGLAYYPEEMMLGSMHLLIKNVKGK
ncbi:MAG: MBL fold metallo-hydrolase [Syntrophomonadaceae bacterium]|nr:MBL fold metallo-hydrolase [Syntrophomonadaceae bacterium]MDD3024210.1 MBL fold metallo-hydrolase [Syntrophomonadaceae bacterium]